MNAFQGQLAAAKGSSLANPEAELSLLGDLLADNRLIDDAADQCRPADFTVPIYGQAFARILDLARPGLSVDAVMLAPYFDGEEDWPRTFKILSAAHLNAGPIARTSASRNETARRSGGRKSRDRRRDRTRMSRGTTRSCPRDSDRDGTRMSPLT